jgi:hypothetical protein
MVARVLRRRGVAARGVLVLAGLALVVWGCFARLSLSDLRERIPRPEQGPLLTMSACKAIQDPEVDCVTCHRGGETEELAGMPDRDLCLSCHGGMPDVGLFDLGGEHFDAAGQAKWELVARLPDDVGFAHNRHKDLECLECHGDIERVDFTLMDLAIHYDNCRRCHKHADLWGECRKCHSSFDPSQRPHSHDARWLDDHSWSTREAGGPSSADQACGSCHDNSYCVDCHHETKPRDHTLFWARAGHGVLAETERGRCYACHGGDECMSCHLDGAPPREPWCEGLTSEWRRLNCTAGRCHPTQKTGHVILTDNCLFCHP